jgi:hypothetical protein
MKRTNKGKWHVWLSPKLRPAIKTLAAASQQRVGDFISDILDEKLMKPEVNDNGM